MKQASRRLLRAWGVAVLVGVLPAAIWGWQSAAPVWFNVAKALTDAIVVSLAAAALAGVALVAGREHPDGGQRAAIGVATGSAVAVWLALLYVQVKYL